MQAILIADYSFAPQEYWRGISDHAKVFIQQCLTIDPTKRITAHEALSHEWIAGPEANKGDADLLPNVRKNFNARRTLHKAIDTVRAINQLRAGGGLFNTMMNGATNSDHPEKIAHQKNENRDDNSQVQSPVIDSGNHTTDDNPKGLWMKNN